MPLAKSDRASQGTGAGVRLNVKLADDRASNESAVEDLRSVSGVRSVTHTFPDEHDPELATLFLVEVDASDATHVAQQLRRQPAVEYVEPAAPRVLIR